MDPIVYKTSMPKEFTGKDELKKGILADCPAYIGTYTAGGGMAGLGIKWNEVNNSYPK
jgi:hypothetical protein